MEINLKSGMKSSKLRQLSTNLLATLFTHFDWLLVHKAKI